MIQNRIRKKQLDYTWPGFVDALSSLLMVIIFVLMIFVISQFFISQKMSGQDEALINLKTNLTELSELLSLERDTTTELTAQLSVLEDKFTIIKEDLKKERAMTKQYQEEIRGTKNIIALNENEINELKIALEEKIKNTNQLKNEVLDLGDAKEISGTNFGENRAIVGQPVGVFFLAEFAMTCFTSLHVRSGYASSSTATPPATEGAAEDVPLKVDV